ncbi:Phasin [Frigidibacter sp. ROC022]|uniref:Phasin n=1 Tax=Frigidibacter sp. ROC022 TaxID=2971796 RepID=UPI00215A7592|nr:Phasin [Frigidibacter sp. ROC022]MCR8723056.1 Phasin [Frigidibacter sp. ROC022]
MTNPPDFMKIMQDAAAAFQAGPAKMPDMLKANAEIAEKFAKVALGAAEKSAELSATYARETLSKLGEVSKVQAEPQGYGAAMQAFAKAQADLMQSQVAAFAEIAKEVQTDTVELMMSAAETAKAEAAAAMDKAAKPGKK